MNQKFIGGGYLGKNNKTAWIFAIEIAGLVSICLLHALHAGHYVDFSPINGTFQNFNPVRRMLDGQVPYRDFQDYLGLGHLYTGTIFTALFGKDYQSSLIAFSFLTLLCTALMAVMIGNAIFPKKESSLLFTNIFLLLLVIQPLFFKYILAGTEDVLEALNKTLSPGNSARFVRGMIIPITYFLLLLGDKGYLYLSEKTPKIKEKKNIVAVCGVSLVSGFAFVWSNDYGISSWLCLAIMTFFIILFRQKKMFRALTGVMIEIGVSVIAIFLFAELFTMGHASNWFRSVMGTGGYQAWYYNSEKSFYLYDIDISYLMLVQAFLCVVYLLKMLQYSASKSAILRYGVPAYANMVGFCAANEYKLLSGEPNREVVFTVLFISVLFEGCRFIWSFLKVRSRKAILAGTFLVGFSWILSTTKNEFIFYKIADRNGIYFEQLGGNMTTFALDILSATKFLKGENFFATYASAQEAVEEKYQPSGIDYIIHVLGDDARKDYLEDFKKRSFKYAATIEENYTAYGYWIKSANWFFYRNLYEEWHPVYANSYETYWERNEEDENHVVINNCSVNVLDIDHATKKIVVQTDSPVSGVADINIEYAVQKGTGKNAKLLFQTMMKVENSGIIYTNAENAASWECNYLRPAGKEYIPVTVVDGYGEVTLTSCPKRDTNLEVYEANCSKVFTVEFEYTRAYGVTDNGDQSVIYVREDAKTEKMLEGVKDIIMGGKQYHVSEVQPNDGYYCIVIQTDGTPLNADGSILENGNIIQIVR